MSNYSLVGGRGSLDLDLRLRTTNLMKSKFENLKWRWVKPIELIELIRTPFLKADLAKISNCVR